MLEANKIIRTLYQISTEHHLGFEHQTLKMLKLGRYVFGMDIGILSKIEGNKYEILHVSCDEKFDLEAGASFELGMTYCSELLSRNHPLAIEYAKESDLHNHPAYKTLALESYIGTTIFVKGRVYGTLNFSSPDPLQRKFAELDYDVIQLMAVWIGSELDRLDDAARLRSAYENLKSAEERFRLGIDASPSAMIMINENGRIVHINQLGESMFGYKREELLDQTIEILVPRDLRGKHSKQRIEYENKPSFKPMDARKNLTAMRKNGEIFPVEIGLNPINIPGEGLVLCAVQDITERKLYEQTILDQAEELKRVNTRLAELASTDSLTKIANRRSLMTHFEILLARASRNKQPLSFLLADIDHFKDYNDDHGHLAGDDALKSAGDLLVVAARRSDIVARYGGEEFAMLLPDTDIEGAMNIAERCRESIEKQSIIEHPITASFGVTTIVIDRLRTDSVQKITHQLISEADKALYQSKNSGRNRVTHFIHCKT